MRQTLKTALLVGCGLAAVLCCGAIVLRLACAQERQPLGTLTVYAWEDYLSSELLAQFTRETGVSVKVDTFATIDESLATLESQAGRYDLALVDEVALEPLSVSKLIRPFNRKLLPNVSVDPRFADPHGLGVAYLWGCTGLAFDKRRAPQNMEGLAILWDSRYRGRIAVLDDVFEVMDLLFLHSGFPSNSTSPEALEGARLSALALAANGVRLGNTFDNIEALQRGEVDIAQTYSGDLLYRAGSDPNIGFILPKEGYNTWVDYFVLPSGSRRVVEAHALVAFLSRKEISVRSAAQFHYDSPIAGAQSLVSSSSLPSVLSLPPIERRKQGSRFRTVGPAIGEYQKIFNELRRRLP